MKKKLKKANPTKTSPVQRLKLLMAARHNSQGEISELRRMLTNKSARQVELETSGDLNDKAVIVEIGRLQVLVQMLPRRIAFKEEADVKAEETLVRATNEFIQGHLGPRVRRLAARTRMIVEKELSAHVRSKSALIIAVAQSERVRSIERLDCAVSLQPQRGAIAHAEGALKAWANADQFEKTLLADECMAGDCFKS